MPYPPSQGERVIQPHLAPALTEASRLYHRATTELNPIGNGLRGVQPIASVEAPLKCGDVTLRHLVYRKQDRTLLEGIAPICRGQGRVPPARMLLTRPRLTSVLRWHPRQHSRVAPLTSAHSLGSHVGHPKRIAGRKSIHPLNLLPGPAILLSIQFRLMRNLIKSHRQNKLPPEGGRL